MEPTHNGEYPTEKSHQHAARYSDVYAPSSLLPAVLNKLGLDKEQKPVVQVENIRAALHHPEWQVRAAATRMLGTMGQQAPVDLLLTASHDEHVSVRVTAIHALGMLARSVPVERLVQALQDNEWQVREAAVLTLGELGERMPVEPLLVALHDRDESVRDAVRCSLQQTGRAGFIFLQSSSPPIFSASLSPWGKNTRNSGGHMQETDFQTREYSPMLQSLEGTKLRPPRRSRMWSKVAMSVAIVFVAINVVAWAVVVQRLRPYSSSIGSSKPILATPTAQTPSGVFIGKTLYSYSCQADGIHALSWSPDGQLLASACLNLTAREATTGKHVVYYGGDTGGSILSVAWSPDGKRIEESSQTVQIWDTATKQLLVTYTPKLAQVSLTSPHSNPLAQYNPRSGGNMIYSSAWSPDGTLVASSVDGNAYGFNVQVWNSRTGQMVFMLQPTANSTASDYIQSVTWSPDGKYIAFTVDGKVEVWSVATKQLVVSHPGGQNTSSLAWSHSGNFIASTEPDGTVQVWNAITGAVKSTYDGHVGGGAGAVAWSPDDTRIASTGRDVQVWDAATGNPVFTYKGHGNSGYTYVISVTWSPDGKYIASGDTTEVSNSTVKVWVAE